MSYTTFAYSDIAVSSDRITPDGSVVVSITVQNTGNRAGEEVVQLYIRDRVSSLIRPIRELKGFDKIYLDPGEEKRVSIELGPEELGMFNQQMEFVVEPGIFEVWMGWNCEEGLHGTFEVINK